MRDLKLVSRKVRTGVLPSEASAVGLALARNSIVVSLAAPLKATAYALIQFGDKLAFKQLDWQADKNAKGITEKALVDRLNKYLDLDKAPEYLRIRPVELKRARVSAWSLVPELTTRTDQRPLRPGSYIGSDHMSPFEAFFVADFVLKEKLYNDDFLRTSAEEQSHLKAPREHLPPGLYVATPNPRKIEFENHLTTLATTKYRTAASIETLVDRILAGQDDDK